MPPKSAAKPNKKMQNNGENAKIGGQLRRLHLFLPNKRPNQNGKNNAKNERNLTTAAECGKLGGNNTLFGANYHA